MSEINLTKEQAKLLIQAMASHSLYSDYCVKRDSIQPNTQKALDELQGIKQLIEHFNNKRNEQLKGLFGLNYLSIFELSKQN